MKLNYSGEHENDNRFYRNFWSFKNKMIRLLKRKKNNIKFEKCQKRSLQLEQWSIWKVYFILNLNSKFFHFYSWDLDFLSCNLIFFSEFLIQYVNWWKFILLRHEYLFFILKLIWSIFKTSRNQNLWIKKKSLMFHLFWTILGLRLLVFCLVQNQYQILAPRQ